MTVWTVHAGRLLPRSQGTVDFDPAAVYCLHGHLLSVVCPDCADEVEALGMQEGDQL